MKKLKIILLFSFILSIVILFFRIKNDSVEESNITSIDGIVKEYSVDGDKLNIIIDNYKVIYYFKSEKELNDFNISYGDKIKFIGNSYIPKNNTNFNMFNYRLYLKSKKINYIFNADKYTVIKHNKNIFYKIKQSIKDRIERNNSSIYLKLFLLGNKEELDYNISSTYSNNGISHLFAVSGMHISLLTLIIYLILNKFIKNKILNNIIVSIFLVFFSFLTSFSSSVLRAVMLFILCKIFKRIKTQYILLIIFMSLILYNPFYIYDIGFLYSFIITFGLIIFSDKINGKNYFIKVFKTSLISFLLGIPISILNFHEINLISPILNIIFVPFISFIIFPLSIITFVFPPLSCIFNFFINILEGLSIFFNNITYFKLILKHVSLFYIFLYYFVITFILYKNKVKYYVLFLFILIIHSNINYINSNFYLTMLDVGQGDSILIELPHNSLNILIDTGGKFKYNNDVWKVKKEEYSIASSITIPYLKSRGIKKIDYLILTHGDYDHMGEAINLVNNFKIERVIFNCGELNDLEKKLTKVLDQKNIKHEICINNIKKDNYNLEFLNTKIYDNENDSSSVIYLNYNDYKFLFMGDAGIGREKDILDKYNLSDIDVLKVGHHGSNTSSSENFIKNISPKYSLISVGENNRYGHPKDSVLNILRNSKIYRTDIDGSIMFKIKNNKLKTETCNP